MGENVRMSMQMTGGAMNRIFKDPQKNRFKRIYCNILLKNISWSLTQLT